MTIEKEVRTAITETRQNVEQLDEKVLNRAVESLDEDSSVQTEEREHVMQQRKENQHLQETMLSRAQESLETSDSADNSTSG